ncbi:MAG: divergent polysaccharide deacetylase family protein [Dinoroseobacter sp.]|nr:divergent polysaccharide deacetylase family protein [Dinoroseobacter sp.]
MLKGLLSGVIWGAIISVFIVVGASLNAPLPGPRTGTVDIPASGAFGTLAPETPLVVPATEPEPDLPDPNRTQLEDPAPLDITEVAPEGVVPEDEAPVPETIEPESAEIPVEPETPEASDPINTEPPATEQVATDATEAVTPEAETPATATPDTEAPETEAPEIEAPETQEPETRAPDVSDAVDPDDEDIIEPELTEDPVDTEPVDTDIEAPTLDEIPETSAEAEASDASEEPAQETPVEVPTEITEPTEGQLDEAPEADPVEATPTEDTQPQDVPEIAPQSPTLNAAIGFGGGALRRNALDIPVDTSLPLFSIIVIDRSGSGLPLSEVAAYPAPLTVALDPTQPGAIEASEGYAASGHEVLILANSLPSDAAPLAAAAALTQLLNQMPTAVGVLLPPGSPFVRDATRASELTAILAQSGHGLVSLPQGLDALGRAAAVADVPDAEVFRVLDSQDEGVPLMTRYMDRAAFQAARDGSVVVLGIVQQKTMDALNQWLEGRRAATVAVAPISKVMLQE